MEETTIIKYRLPTIEQQRRDSECAARARSLEEFRADAMRSMGQESSTRVNPAKSLVDLFVEKAGGLDALAGHLIRAYMEAGDYAKASTVISDLLSIEYALRNGK